MNKVLIGLLLYCISTTSLGQQYTSADIVEKAESMMVSEVGRDVFEKHYQFDSSSYLVTKTLFGRTQQKPLLKSRRINGKMKRAVVKYTFHLIKDQNPVNNIWLHFDHDLYLEHPVSTDYLPEFVLQNAAYNLITREEALGIAKKEFKLFGSRLEARIYYSSQRESYMWEISNILNEWIQGGNVEVLEIDAESKEIIFHFTQLRGKLH